RFQFVYGTLIMFVHVMAFYLLIMHTVPWARGVRAAYVLYQTQMLMHDVWTCFLLRGYTLLPYPGIFCAGPICPIVGGFVSYAIENLFMVNLACVLMFFLLVMHQQLLPPASSLSISRRSLIMSLIAMYLVLVLNPIAALLAGSDPPNRDEIL
ncbi:hypothetical protein PMAYCL1PPCAC_20683, partial [Pristionchus mayeri]